MYDLWICIFLARMGMSALFKSGFEHQDLNKHPVVFPSMIPGCGLKSLTTRSSQFVPYMPVMEDVMTSVAYVRAAVIAIWLSKQTYHFCASL